MNDDAHSRGNEQAQTGHSEVRDLVYVAIFGALWGGLEMSLGAYLHLLHLPFAGVLMGALGLLLALVGRLFVPRRGSVLMIGVVAALLKMLSLGGIVLSPMIAILAEAVLAELVLLAFRRPGRGAFALAGALGVLWNLFHPFLTQGLMAGRGIVTVYGWALESGARLLGISPGGVGLILVSLVAIHLAVGALAGVLAWDVGRLVQSRVLAREEPSP